MRVLNENEIEQVGGAWLSPFMWGMGASLGGNYLYDAFGGIDGINAGLSAAWDSAVNAALMPVHYSS